MNRRTHTPNGRRPAPNGRRLATPVKVRPASRAEEQFVTGMGQAMAYATAIVAADPERAWSRDSIAERVSQAYRRYQPERHEEFKERAVRYLSGTTLERRRYFGDFGERHVVAAPQEPELDEGMLDLLDRAVVSRLDQKRPELLAALAKALPFVPMKGSGEGPSKTQLEAGFFHGDVQASWTSLNLSEPTVVGFRWSTDEVDAEIGIWRLIGKGPIGGPEFVLASGLAGSAPGSEFSIDLREYLPPGLNGIKLVYFVEVTPSTKMKYQPGATVGLPGKKVPGKAVGPPSNRVVINYSYAAPQPLDEQEPWEYLSFVRYFQRAYLTIGDIRLIQDQTGAGAEEFHVTGFVQEHTPAGSGKQVAHLGGFALLDPDGPTSAGVGGLAYFDLPAPDTPSWPRAYTLVLSVLEEDDGGSLDDWLAAIDQAAHEVLQGQIGAAVSDYLSDLLEEYFDENLDDLVDLSLEIAQIVEQLADSIGGVIAAAVAVVIATIVVSIILGMQDDYYGTEAFVMPLPSNLEDIVVVAVPGYFADDTDHWHVETEPFLFLGPAEWNSAAPFDGMVEVDFAWTLENPVSVSVGIKT